jgi:general secretion pathway protein G
MTHHRRVPDRATAIQTPDADRIGGSTQAHCAGKAREQLMLRHNIREARRQHADGGFTLIELLIVIVVLGILAGIVVFGVSTMRDDSVKAACHADMKQVATAAEAFNAKEGLYPANVDLLVTAHYLRTAPDRTTYQVDYTASGTNSMTASGYSGYTAYTITGQTVRAITCGPSMKS